MPPWQYFALLRRPNCASGLQRVPDFLGGLGLPVQAVVVGVNPQGHVHRAVSGKVLNLLDVQPRLKETGKDL